MKSYSISSKCSFLETLVENLHQVSTKNPFFLLPTKGSKIDFQELYSKTYGTLPKVFVLNETIEDDLPEHFLFSLVFKLLSQELKNTPLESLLSFPETLIYLSKTFISSMNEILSYQKKREIYFQGEELESLYFDIFYKIKKKIEEFGFILAPQKRIERSQRLQKFLVSIPLNRPIIAAGIVALKPFTLNILESLQERENFHLFISGDIDLTNTFPQGHPFYLGHKLLKNFNTEHTSINKKTENEIAILECQTIEEESIQIAQKLYELEKQSKKTAFVTHNNLLKTLVKEELLKFNILPASKETLSFANTPAGRFIRLTAVLLFGDFSLETIFSFLKNPFSKNNLEDIYALEHALKKKAIPIDAFIKRQEFKKYPVLEEVISQKIQDQTPKPPDFYIEYLKNFLQNYTDSHLPSDAFKNLPPLTPKAFLNIFEEILKNTKIPDPEHVPYSSYIHFWSPLEARLRKIDVMILGDLTENSWPQNSSNPWICENLRQTLDLPSSLTHQGLSYLDFLMLSKSAKSCIITHSILKNGTAQTPSRFLYHDLNATKLSPKDKKINFIPLKAQGPATATLEQKPLHLHQSDVKLLIQNPYIFYLRKILKIQPSQEFQKGLTSRILGSLIHKAFECTLKGKTFYVEEFMSLNPYQKAQLAHLLENFKEKIIQIKTMGWEFFPEYEKTVSFGPVSVSARMDLVLKKGSMHRIIDYKTSLPPSFKSILEWREPQLSLEALCLDNVTSLEYWHTPLAGKEITPSILSPQPEWMSLTKDFFDGLFEKYIRDDFVFEQTENFFEKDDQHFMKIQF